MAQKSKEARSLLQEWRGEGVYMEGEVRKEAEEAVSGARRSLAGWGERRQAVGVKAGDQESSPQ